MTRKSDGLSFENFVDAINQLAASAGALDRNGIYCDGEAWRISYDDDVTPAEAWAEECSYAEA